MTVPTETATKSPTMNIFRIVDEGRWDIVQAAQDQCPLPAGWFHLSYAANDMRNAQISTGLRNAEGKESEVSVPYADLTSAEDVMVRLLQKLKEHLVR